MHDALLSFLFDTRLQHTWLRAYNSLSVQNGPIFVAFPSDEHSFQAIYFSGFPLPAEIPIPCIQGPLHHKYLYR
jgi:hypothetical protein